MAIKLDPKAPAPYVNRATVRRDLGYVDGALEDYQKAIGLGGDSARLYGGRAQLYLRQHDYVHALADFDHALKLDASAANYMARARAKQDNGDFDGALADYAEAARLDPKNVGAYTAQATIWTMKDDFDKAIAAYDRAIAADQTRAETYALRAHAYDQKGDRKRALADINRAIKLSPQAAFLQLRGTLKLQDGDVDAALRDAEAALKGDGDNAAALTLRGSALARRSNTTARSPISTGRSSATPTALALWRTRAGLSGQIRQRPHALRPQPRHCARIRQASRSIARARQSTPPRAIPTWRSPTSTRCCRASRTMSAA